ncbi:MAG: SRPBCC domain-containing protein [Actinomycetota bacterium]
MDFENSGPTGTLSISRVVAAPIERVWAAYMDPDQFVQFWAPEGVEIPRDSVVIEPFVGGRFECTMVVDGVPQPNAGTFVEFQEKEHFRFGEPADGEGFSSVMSFTAVDGGTRIDVEQRGIPLQFHDAATAGFTSVFDQLERLLATG